MSICLPSAWQLYFIFSCKLINLNFFSCCNCSKCVFRAHCSRRCIFLCSDIIRFVKCLFIVLPCITCSCGVSIYLTHCLVICHLVFVVLPCTLWTIAQLTSATVFSTGGMQLTIPQRTARACTTVYPKSPRWTSINPSLSLCKQINLEEP